MAWRWLPCLLLPALLESVAANTPPRFLSNMSVVSLPEDLPVGDEAFWLAAEDLDKDPLTYGITGDYAYFFSVIEDTGEVKLEKALDFETLYRFTIRISVSDNYNREVEKDMHVVVEDRNDNAPVFQNTMFATSVNETLPVGSLVFSVLATDPDTSSGGVVQYFIDKVIPSTPDSEHLFEILENGSIVLNNSLNYNSKSAFYQLELKACDSGGLFNNTWVTQCSQPVFLSISVVDQPDLDPQFVREFYSASVYEDAAVNTPVLTVQAVDRDRGINDVIIYSISNSTRPGWFAIGDNGVIKVSGPLDREELLEENDEVQVEVTAKERNINIYGQVAKVSTWVTITVLDVNDHKPEFYNCILPDCSFTPQEAQNNFTAYVDEHASARIPVDNLTMVVYDPDKGSHGTFLLSLEGPGAAAFSVSPERGVGSADVQVLVRNSEMVDYENQNVMLVQVVATDSVSKNSSFATVTIHLRDTNDHRPTFPQRLYVLSVLENSATGSVVSNNTHAEDLDTGEWGHVTYSLLPGNGEELFEVDPDSGTVMVRNGTLLDRERQAVYYLTLQATDGGGLSDTTMLQIHLLDVNDNPPVVTGSYNIFVPEEEGDVSVIIQAYDNDEPGTNNSLLLFSLLPGPYSQNFSVDPDTGLLRNVGPLDREAIDPALGGRIALTVRVADYGEPQLSTEVNVTVTVEDINDNLPVFNQSSYQFFVKEKDPGVLVGKVEAWDADQTEVNNRISFSLSGAGANNFVLQRVVLGFGRAEGQLWLPSDISLDYEVQDFFQLNVNAENPATQVSEATAGVNVTVVDVNDEPPTLVEASLQGISVSENGSEHGEVAVVVAQDVDTGAQVEIQLMNVICTKAGVDVGHICQGWFSVAVNGSVYINQSEAIDYEACDQVTLVVRAYDLNTDPRFQAYSKDGSLLITIEDVNDNAPYFLLESRNFVIIPELVKPGQQVASVRARDADSGDNGAILFSLLRVDFISKDGTTTDYQRFFRISTSSEAGTFLGSIELVTNLDSSLQGTYQVIVKAQDRPSVDLGLEATVPLNLFTVDQNYRLRLQFSTQKEEVGSNVELIKAALAQATKTSVYVVNIQDIDSLARAQALSYLDAYFVFDNGTALTLEELSVMIRQDQAVLSQLLQMGLVVLGSQGDQESDQPKLLTSAVIGLAVALVLVLVVMIVAFVCVQKSNHRKLQAMKASKEAQKTAAGLVPSAPAIPGTNMYNTERANPMLNLPIERLEYLASSTDLDHVSLNSLDDNSVDLDRNTQETKKESLNSVPAPHPEPEPLTAVLSGGKADLRGQKQEGLFFTNTSLDTTDL